MTEVLQANATVMHVLRYSASNSMWLDTATRLVAQPVSLVLVNIRRLASKYYDNLDYLVIAQAFTDEPLVIFPSLKLLKAFS